ncbi:MAG: histidine kinase [Brumimicrobium sp.]
MFFLLTINAFCNSEKYHERYKKSENKKEKEQVIVDWLAYSTQHDVREADSLFKSQIKHIGDYSAESKFKVYIYGLINKSTIDQTKIPHISELNFNKNTLDYYLLESFYNVCFNNELNKNIKDKLKAGQSQLKDANRKTIFALIFAHDAKTQKNFTLQENRLFKALKHAKRANIKQLTSTVLKDIASFYSEKEDFEKAVLYHQKGLDFAIADNRNYCQAFHTYKLGEIQYNIKNYHKAKDYFESALNEITFLKSHWLEAVILEGLGSTYLKSKNKQRAIYFYQRSLIKFYKIDNQEGIATIHKHLGRIYFNEKNYNLADNNYNLSQSYFEDLNNKEDLGEIFHYQAELELEKGNLHNAKIKIKKAIQLRKEFGKTIDLNNSYFLYSKISNRIGDFKTAHKYLTYYTNYQDSINGKQTQEKIAELSELYQAEQKEKRIINQQRKIKEQANQQLLKDQQLENTKLKNRQMITVLIFSVVLFLSILIIIYFKTKQNKLKKQQLEAELKQTLLRSQMNPHFIFNSMSIIQSYIYDNDLKNSSKFLVNFSRLIRLILENSAKEFIMLSKEIEILERYLEIQKQRFEDRFNFEIRNLDNIETNSVLIPPMLLQPFIENALEHGELDKIKNGKIRITFKIENDLLIFGIEDNGIGRHAAMQKKIDSKLDKHKSMAIDITNSRIDLLNDKYKKAGFLFIQDLSEIGKQGTNVTIATPFQINK